MLQVLGRYCAQQDDLQVRLRDPQAQQAVHLASRPDPGSFQVSTKLDSCCSTAAGRTPWYQEVMGYNSALYWAFTFFFSTLHSAVCPLNRSSMAV